MDEELEEQLPSRTYRIMNGHVAGWIDELEAMRQAVEKILTTERFAWSIYSDNYGVELQDLIGEDFDLIKSEIERVVSEALLADDRISSLDSFVLIQVSRTSLQFNFTATTIFGDISVEQEVVA